MTSLYSLRRGGLIVAAVAIMAIGVGTRAFASVDMYLQIKDEKGKITKVKLASDGSFTTPALKAGTYTFSWSISPQPASRTSRAVVAGTTSVAGTTDPTPAQVSCTYSMYGIMKGARDASSGMASGKRMHKPVTISKSIDIASPSLMTRFDAVTLDEDCDGLEGKISFTSADGKPMAADIWSPKSN
jgi:hypothetical protein